MTDRILRSNREAEPWPRPKVFESSPHQRCCNVVVLHANARQLGKELRHKSPGVHRVYGLQPLPDHSFAALSILLAFSNTLK